MPYNVCVGKETRLNIIQGQMEELQVNIGYTSHFIVMPHFLVINISTYKLKQLST